MKLPNCTTHHICDCLKEKMKFYEFLLDEEWISKTPLDPPLEPHKCIKCGYEEPLFITPHHLAAVIVKWRDIKEQRDALIKELVEALEYVSAWPPNHNYLPVIKNALKRAKEVMGDE